MERANRSRLRCAIYTRKSSEEGLEQDFNSLDAQREACEAFILSQRHEGWKLVATAFADGGFSGGTMDRPALTRLLAAIKQGEIDIIVVYKVDRLSRSLADFVRLVELFDRYGVSFVSVTQQFNTSTSMGRLTLNVLLSFAQFEREVTSERIRDKIAASKKKGLWMGGRVPLGYDARDRQLVVNEQEAELVRHIFARYQALGSVRLLKGELDAAGYLSKRRNGTGKAVSGRPFARGGLYAILRNPLYIGKIPHKGEIYEGQHPGIIAPDLWQAVQAQLARSKERTRRRTAAKDPSLLAGLIFDDRGNPMSPSHGTKKNNRRYRYYVSQALIQFRGNDAGSVARIPATTIEDLVVGKVHELLNAHSLLDIARPLRLHVDQQQTLIEQAGRFLAEWVQWTPQQQIAQLQRILARVTVGQREVTILVLPAALLTALRPGILDGEFDDRLPRELCVTLPVALKRRGFEKRLVLPSGDPSAPPHASTMRLQQHLHQALIWHSRLVSGQAKSLADLARREHLDLRIVSRRLQFAYLAPDIMQAILDGDIPIACSPDKFKRSLPDDWAEQRQRLGFPPVPS